MQVAITVLCTTVTDYAKQESTPQKQNRLDESAKLSWQICAVLAPTNCRLKGSDTLQWRFLPLLSNHNEFQAVFYSLVWTSSKE